MADSMQKYTIIPNPTGVFEGIDALARLTFGLIWDRYRLSSYNVTGAAEDSKWYDYRRDEIFCLYSQADLPEQMGCGVRTVKRCLDDLKAAGLIDWRKADYKGVCRYYVSEYTREYMYSK